LTESLQAILRVADADRATPDTLLDMWVDDLDAIATEFGVELERAGWDDDVLEVQLSDPDGNRRIGQRAT
jgi:hypothetical protein